MGCFKDGNPFVWLVGGDGFAVDAFGFLAKPFDETGGIGDFPKGFRDGLPISAVSIMARSCWFSMMRSNHLRRIWARSLPVRAAQAWRADSAAFMAVAASLRDKSGRLARMSPRAGL